jgi:hypothetical protein
MWVDNIKIDLREIEWGGMDWIDMDQDRDLWRAVVNTVMNRQVPVNIGKYLSSCRSGCFSKWIQFHGHMRNDPFSDNCKSDCY